MERGRKGKKGRKNKRKITFKELDTDKRHILVSRESITPYSKFKPTGREVYYWVGAVIWDMN